MAILGFLSEESVLWRNSVTIAISLIVVFYVSHLVKQLLPRDERTPPMVFHWFPWLGSMVVYGMDPYAFFFSNREKYGDFFSYVMGGRIMTCALGTKGNDLVFNGKLSQVSAEEAYTSMTTPVFGKGVVYDVPNHVFMEQKKFVKFGLTMEILRTYVPLIAEEYKKYVSRSGEFGIVGQKSGTTNLMKAMPELTIFTAARTLQGREVREGFDASFAKLYYDLDRI